MNPVFLPPDFGDSHAAYMVDNMVRNGMIGFSFEWTKKSPGWQNWSAVTACACADPPGKWDLKNQNTVFEK